MTVSSDAHVSYEVGYFGPIPDLLDELEIPSSLVVNASRENLTAFLQERGKNVPEI